ncbi:uncharacterized protein LOC110036247 [Phalaenopsis equestris]|uniref:uncharacterized protein LOC110036247 n=1 Tax=Phalaenopsis equestris TaxID=78828 RepID=UPI0009E4ACA1|nr:uncharacterized protein LOC110036247 [Phalaenopsis equestris]
MASAQVMTDSATSSRKLGHLEAGKKKLEEFRKRKAEGRAKKAGSTGQLQSIDEVSIEKSSQNKEHQADTTNSSTSAGFSGSHTTPVQKEVVSSTDKHVISSNESAQMFNSFEKSSYTGLVNGYHEDWKERSELSDTEQSKYETASIAISGQFTAFGSVHTDVNPDEGLVSSSLYSPPLYESRTSSARVSYLNASNTASLQKAESASVESRLGLPSTSLSSSLTSNDSVPGLGIFKPVSFNNKGLVDTHVGRKTISESINQRLNLGSASLHSSEPSPIDSSLPIRRSREAHLSSSTGYEVTSSRTRQSFLDTLGVSRASPTAHVPLYELHKANLPVSSSDSVVQSADVHFPSHQQPFTNANSVQKPSSSSPSVLVDEKVNSFASSNDKLMLETSGEYLQGGHELLVPKKDEDFSALEQHIEDLTQEKFTFQRALDASRTLADSLAAENSSLTETHNHQAKFISELKSEIERLQEEVKDQLRAVESLKLEYANAQLECNAADERAKILASEVIGLEEKALRLRSNELKLEKQSENFSSEIASYKRKVSVLEKERQDFQSTINAMQEEKKLLQTKLRKASSNSKVDDAMRSSSSRRDMSTSTDDLGDDIDRQINEAEIMARNTMRLLQNNTALNDFVTTTSSPSDGISVDLLDASIGIPRDQLRMIDNISSLMSELALEKEELMQALTIETSSSSKLKDLNKELSRKLEAQTQRLELLTAQRMANENILTKSINTHNIPDTMDYADEGDEVVERVLGWIMKFFPGGSSKRRTSKLL